jgi:hypothetical protein
MVTQLNLNGVPAGKFYYDADEDPATPHVSIAAKKTNTAIYAEIGPGNIEALIADHEADANASSTTYAWTIQKVGTGSAALDLTQYQTSQKYGVWFMPDWLVMDTGPDGKDIKATDTVTYELRCTVTLADGKEYNKSATFTVVKQ